MYKAFQDYVTDVALERNWKAYWNPDEGDNDDGNSESDNDSGENNIFICQRCADSVTPVYKSKRFQFTQFTVEDESDNSEDVLNWRNLKISGRVLSQEKPKQLA
eukprot:Pgem_evm2s15012